MRKVFSAVLGSDYLINYQVYYEGTFMFGFVDGLVSLDEDRCAPALHGDGGIVVEDVAFLGEVTVPPHLQMSLAS